MKATSLTTHHLDVAIAVEHLKAQADALGFQPKGAILFTAGIREPDALVAAIYDAIPVPTIGTKTTGTGSHSSDDHSASAVLVVFGGDDCTVRTGLLENVSGQKRTALALTQDYSGGKVCFAFPDAMTTSTDLVLREIQILVGRTPVVGGFSADDWTFDTVTQFYNGKTYRDSAPFLVLGGDFTIAVSNQSGVIPLTPERFEVTAQGRSLCTIGEQRAYDYYLEKVGDQALFGEFPVLFEDNGRLRCRSPLSSSPETGRINCGADIPQGARIALGSATRTQLIEASRDGAERAVRDCEGQADFAFVISCAARARRLGMRADEERQAIANAIGIPFSLAYVYGELAPSNGEVSIENNHIVILAMGHRK